MFKSRIQFRIGNTVANAKSVLSVLGACVKSGDEIEFICEGEDEKEALSLAALDSSLKSSTIVHLQELGLAERQ